MLIKNDSVTIYFGVAGDNLSPAVYFQSLSHDAMRAISAFDNLCDKLELKYLLFLRQVHGTRGKVINTEQEALHAQPFSQEGDFLITKLRHVGIGVMTADCLPVIVYDKTKQIIGIAHAGWRGLVNGVVIAMLDAMRQQNCTLHDLRIIIGPAARPCCYQVDQQFIDNLNMLLSLNAQQRSYAIVNGIYYVNLSQLCIEQLTRYGIAEKQIDVSYNFCTICNHSYCSYRRDGQKAGRQMTVVSLV